MTGLEELDEADIEEAIRQELEALDDLDLKNLESFSDGKYESTQTDLSDAETKLSSEEKYGLPPDSVETFIRLLQSKNDKLQEELAEAEDAVRSASQHKNTTAVVENENKEDDMKISPQVKEKVLHEIEELDKDDIVTEKKDADDENTSSLEEIALRSLKELKMKQDERSDQLNNLFNEIKEDEIVRHEKEEKMREENKRKASEEHKMKMNENQSLKMKIEEEAKCQQQKLQDLQKQFELEMKYLEKRRKEEKLALERMKSEERRKRETQKELACITIQKNFRMYRVQSKYDKKLKMKREERHKRRQDELDALERKEKRLMEEAIQKAKEEEMRRLKEIENEKKRKEEEEKKRLEDERRKAEEEELRKKLERKQEEERKMKLEMEQRQEEERLERERLEKEEQERKMAEERKKREEEERWRIEEQRKLEEEKRLEEQRKLEQKKLQEQRELEQRRLEEQKKLEELEQMKIQDEERKQNGMKEITKQDEDCLEAKGGQGKENKINKTWVAEDKSSKQAQMLSKKNVVSSQDKTNNSDLLRNTENSESLNRAKDSRTSNNVLISREHKVNNTISKTLDNEKSIDVCDDSDLEWERCREEWLKQTVPWSTLSLDEKANVKSRSKPRRPLSASQKLPSVSEEELLKSHNKITSLDKIVCINVKDLPPRNLKIMSRCPNVKSVTVQNCSVLSAEGFDNCNHLVELNLSDNSIQNISCQNLQSLEYLDLRNNHLTSIHGLDGYHNLRSLYLDGNKITRIGTLPSNKVTHLSLQNNQLITTKGLSTWKYLQILDCSNNHLSQIQELESCPLLRILKLRGNNLRKPPDLSNHVLLRELHLSENSISSLEGLSDQWLPLLQHLYVDSNSLSSVCSLRNFPMLEILDVKNNLVSDEENLLPGLTACHQLRRLIIQGNPVCEDSNVKFCIIKTLPKLKFLDGEKLESGLNKDNSDGKTIFYPICGAQILAQDDLLQKQKAEIENCQAESSDDNQVVKRLKLQCRHSQELQDLVIKHRLQQENFKKPEMNQGPQRDRASISSRLTQQNKEGEQNEAVKSVSSAKDTSSGIVNHIPSPGVSVAYLNKTAGNGMWKPKHRQAATLIQAKFRGYRIRRRYLEATKTAQYSDIDLETEDFNFDEEVDLNMFDMGEAALDSSWLPTNLPQTARDTVVHDESPPKQEQLTEINEEDGKLPPSQEDSCRPFPRKHAWRSPDSPISSPNPRKVIPPIEAPSVLSEQTSPPIETHRSHRTSELSSEWGFSKNSTAELMLKRANRMKYNALRKKKLTNPEKRLQLFKKADESNKARGVQTVQKRKEKPRVDYFSGRPHGDHQVTQKEEVESQAKKEMTFSWVYDQAVLHKDQGEEILRDTREYYSESKPNKNKPDRSPPGVSLPRMDPVILAGRNLPLVASPVSNPRTPSTYSGDVEIGSRRKYSWQQTKTHSNPDLTRVGLSKESRSGKSNSAEARIIKERNHIL